MKGPEELEGVLEGGVAPVSHDPVLEHSSKKYSSFVAYIFRCGIVKFSSEVKVECGLFFVYTMRGE